MAVPALAAAKMAGAAVNAYGQYLEGKSKYEALNEKSTLNLLRAGEMIQRLNMNIDSIREDAHQFQSLQMVSAAASGTDVASGANLLALENTADMVAKEIANTKRDAYFQKWMMEKEAYSYRQEARTVKTATNLRMAGTILSAGGEAASIDKG